MQFSSEGRALPHDVYYEQRSFWSSLLIKWGFKFRKEIYNYFTYNLSPTPKDTVLDLGVTDREVNDFHLTYPYKKMIVAAGLSKENQLINHSFPQIKYIQVSNKFPYPFRDNEFDIVHSSAVVEHVGSHSRQKKFIVEAVRVGKKGMITTPNRWFPLDFHTCIPFLHWLPPSVYRKIYAILGMEFYSKEENLNLLDCKELKRIVKNACPCKYWIVEKKTFGIVSNLLFFWEKG